MPLVTFIMPVFNTPATLLRRSARSTPLGEDALVELVIVDDGSAHADTLQELDYLERSSDGVRVVHQRNSGVAAARNAGVSHARGKWVSFLDPDDLLLGMNDFLKELGRVEEDCVICSAIGLSADGSTETYDMDKFPSTCPSESLTTELMRLFRYGRESASFLLGVVWAKFFRRSLIMDIPFDTSIVKRSDAEWLIRVFSMIPMVRIVDTPVVRYSVDTPGSISRRFDARILLGFETIASTADSNAEIPRPVLQLYHAELVKDAINSTFANPSAPASATSRKRYLEFRRHFTIGLSAVANGELHGASLQRWILYGVIWSRAYLPLVALRWTRRIEVMGRCKSC